jgi:anaerobic magnesium-protoporphyrin IX monomethyl ester cyclase
MKVLFILTHIGDMAKWHQGVASLATLMRRNGHQADLLEIFHFDLVEIENQIKGYQPDVVAMTVTSNHYLYAKEILAHVKKRMPETYIVLGGVHITTTPEDIIELKGIVDAVCCGEGEQPLLDLVMMLDQGKEPVNIANMCFPGQDNFSVQQSFFVKNLDALPIADRNLFKIYRDADLSLPFPYTVRFLWCRGCPFNCSYCCNKILKKNFPSKSYVRRTSVDKAIEEINLVSSQYNFSHFIIDDDIFTLNKKWTMEFCEKFLNEFERAKTFEANIRIGTVDKEMILALKEAGCNIIKFGLESGDEDIRRKVLDRRISDEEIIETANMAKEAGIKIKTFNMVGIPGEGRREIFKTIRLNQKIRPERVQVTVFYPYPNTPLGEYCTKEGMVDGVSSSYFRESILKHDRLSKYEIALYAKYFHFFIYLTYNLKSALTEIRKHYRGWLGVRQLVGLLRKIKYYFQKETVQ